MTRTFLLILLLGSMISCSKEKDTDLVIKAGFACGWGAGEDSLVITRSQINYVYTVPAQSPKPKIQVSRKTTESEWHEITDAIDYPAFLMLNFNTCNICADGCDEWISLRDADFDHSIRYAKGQEIEDIAELQQILTRLRLEFQK